MYQSLNEYSMQKSNGQNRLNSSFKYLLALSFPLLAVNCTLESSTILYYIPNPAQAVHHLKKDPEAPNSLEINPNSLSQSFEQPTVPTISLPSNENSGSSLSNGSEKDTGQTSDSKKGVSDSNLNSSASSSSDSPFPHSSLPTLPAGNASSLNQPSISGPNSSMLNHIRLSSEISFVAIKAEENSLTLVWEDSGASEMKGYNLYLDDRIVPAGSGVLTRNRNNRFQYTFQNLVPEQIYKLGINGIHKQLGPTKIKSVEVLIKSQLPATPLNLRTSQIKPDSISILWDEVLKAQSYEVFLNSQSIQKELAIPEFTFKNLEKDTLYIVGVRAINDKGLSSIATLELRSGRRTTGSISFVAPPIVPSIFSFTPDTGNVGTVVLIEGTGFGGTTSVTFNGIDAAGFSVSNAQQISAIVPNEVSSGQIQVINPAGVATSSTFNLVTLGVTLSGSGATGSADGIASVASFNSPVGIVVDLAGNLFIADTSNNKIRKITSAGNVTTFAGDGLAGSDDGVASVASFDGPERLVIDSAGNLYIPERGNHKIRKVDSAGNVTTFAGNGLAGTDDGVASAASFNEPRGLAIDSSGNLYVADLQNNKIRKVDSAGNVTTFAGDGVFGSLDGVASAARFGGPIDLTFDSAGNLYVADTFNEKIRKIDSVGNVTTFAGDGLVDSDNGVASVASFNGPFGIVTDSVGNLYVADRQNRKIRKIDSTGSVSTFAGDGNNDSDDGVASSMSFNNPFSLAIDSTGNIYVADTFNNKIRKILEE